MAARLRRVLADAGISQAAFARRVGVSQPYLSEVVRAVSLPSIQLLMGMRAAFMVSPAWFLTGEGEPYGTEAPALSSAVTSRPHGDLHDLLDEALQGANSPLVERVRGYLEGIISSQQPARRSRSA